MPVKCPKARDLANKIKRNLDARFTHKCGKKAVRQ
jgi:hypothetical protein